MLTDCEVQLTPDPVLEAVEAVESRQQGAGEGADAAAGQPAVAAHDAAGAEAAEDGGGPVDEQPDGQALAAAHGMPLPVMDQAALANMWAGGVQPQLVLDDALIHQLQGPGLNAAQLQAIQAAFPEVEVMPAGQFFFDLQGQLQMEPVGALNAEEALPPPVVPKQGVLNSCSESLRCLSLHDCIITDTKSRLAGLSVLTGLQELNITWGSAPRINCRGHALILPSSLLSHLVQLTSLKLSTDCDRTNRCVRTCLYLCAGM